MVRVRLSKVSRKLAIENVYAQYNGGFAPDEDPADYYRPIKAVRLA